MKDHTKAVFKAGLTFGLVIFAALLIGILLSVAVALLVGLP